MKTALRISLVLNLALLIGLIFFITNQRKPAVVTPAPVLVQAEPPAPAVTEAPVPPEPKAPPFRWSQLMPADNYPGFVVNLRSSGCPEATVEDIVRGDMNRAFSWQRSKSGIDGNQPGPWSFQSQTQMVALFLGETQAERDVASNSNPDQTAPPPFVLANVDVKSLGLNADQEQALKMVRQQFVDTVGDPGQNPNDPAYLQRVQNAEPEAENMLRGMLGSKAYQDYFLAAQKSAGGASAGNP